VWESGVPIAVAGFNLGDFKTSSAKTPQGFGVDAYADNRPSGRIPAAAGGVGLRRHGLGNPVGG